MTDYKKEFEQYLRETKKVSDNTLQSYLRDITQFFAFLKGKKPADPTNIQPETVKKYKDSLLIKGKSQATISRALATIRCYYQFLMLNGLASANPASGIKVDKSEKKLPQILNNEEIELLLAQPDTSDIKGCRDKAMLELLYATGIRVTELIDLNLDDVNVQVGVLYCRGEKGERIVPIYPDAVRAIIDYETRVRSVLLADVSELALFTNMNGQRLTRQGFWKIIKTYTRQAGIQKDITPHTLRHSFAAHLLENGAQLKAIQEMLGHADISSTQVYARILKQRFREVYKNCHPKARRA